MMMYETDLCWKTTSFPAWVKVQISKTSPSVLSSFFCTELDIADRMNSRYYVVFMVVICMVLAAQAAMDVECPGINKFSY